MTVSTRYPIIGISLKMYLDHEQTLEWAQAVAAVVASHPAVASGDASVVVFPSFPSLLPVVELLQGSGVGVGAQDLYWEDGGPYTSAVSGTSLHQIGCRYVEIGHAERRQLFGDSDSSIARKVSAAIRNDLTPWLCVGEPSRLEPDLAAGAVVRQIETALSHERPEQLVIAYEPVWAIGAAEPAPVAHVQAVVTAIRAWLDDHGLEDVPVLYGGAAGPGVLTALERSVDGLFLGRFAHDTENVSRVLDELITMWQQIA